MPQHDVVFFCADDLKPLIINPESECSVCLVLPGNTVQTSHRIVLDCHHHFCASPCMVTLAEHKLTECPLCRFPFSQRGVRSQLRKACTSR